VDNYAWSGSGIFCNNSIDQCPGPRNGGPEISNCLFVGNIARMGGFAQVGTLYCYNSDTLIRNCTLANNNYGIFVLQGDVEINNCILQNENYEIETPDWYWPTVNVANCLIRDFKIHKGDNSIIRLNGNINADPCFISTDANDYHLNPASPCINAGNPNFIPEPNETDIDGELRLMLGRVDMGADEFNPFEIDFTVVNKRRVGRTLFEYDCVVTLTNVSRFAVRNVALEIIKAPENMVLIDPAVTFGDIEIGPDETATSLDMCTFRVDRSYATDPAEIIWKSTCEIVDGVPGAQVIASGISFLNLGIIPGDITGNGKVDFYDLQFLVAEAFHTYLGDANLDGYVDGDDYSLIDSGYGNHWTGWFNGDFNGDGLVDGDDYSLIDSSYGNQDPLAGQPVPEPAGATLLALAGLGLLRRPEQARS
jgi:MYXO-CTERM domain-containing protein